MPRWLHIVGDSLARARLNRPDNIPFLQTYAGRLTVRLDDWRVVLQSRVGLNTSLLIGVAEREFLNGLESDAFVLHLGINDCAPRALSARELAWIARMRIPFTNLAIGPKLQPLIRKHHYRLTKRRLWSEVPYDEFTRNLQRVKVLFPSRRHMFIPILTPIARFRAHTHGISEQVVRYNDAMQAAGFERVELRGFEPETHTSTDMIHPNSEGHRIIADAIERQLVGAGTPATAS
jgi:hypothetical protein